MAFALEGPTSIEVKQGESASLTYSILATSKPYRKVSLSLSGLPTGLTARLNPISGNPTFSSTLTLAASVTAPIGTFPIRIMARDAKSSKSMSISIFVVSKGQTTTIYPADFYIAPGGNDSWSGSYDSPFATIQHAHDVMSAGQLCYAHGGTYPNLSAAQTLTKDGDASHLFKIWAYPGEVPLFDGSSIPTGTGDPNVVSPIVLLNANYWSLKGLGVTGTKANGAGFLIYLASGNILLDQCFAHHGTGTGFGGYGAAHDLTIQNCDSYFNANAGSADGFQYSISAGGTNLLTGCRAWRNSDDGFDFFNVSGDSPWRVDNCWSWDNGFDLSHVHVGDGMGFKLGTSGDVTLTRCLSWINWGHGFDHNSAAKACTLYNNTAWNNGDTGFFFATGTVAHILRNNAAWNNPTEKNLTGSCVEDHNTWDGAVTVNNSDFASVDPTGSDGARQTDGSLPVLNFMRLVTGSDLINAGTQTGLPSGVTFLGSNPDMGCFEKE